MYNRILAPLDGSKLSECTLDHLKAIASGCKVPEVILLTVVEPPATPTWWPESQSAISEISANLEKLNKEMHLKAQGYLESAGDRLRQTGVAAKTVLIDKSPDQQVASIILDYIQKNNIDLVVISTHGRGGISRWSFGSVADKVTRYSTVPVMTVTPKGCRI